MAIEVTALDHIALNVTDMARAQRFYGDLLGLEEVPRPDSLTGPGAWYRAGTTVIHLIGRNIADAPSSRHIGLWVENVRQAFDALKAAGCDVRWDGPKYPGLDRCKLQDPDGNWVELQGADGATWAA